MAETRLGAIIQARTGSMRLPGKVVMPLHGRPALAWLIERLSHARALDSIVVATSSAHPDDSLSELSVELGADVYRGSEHDVAARLIEAARRFELDAFVRVNGDSPLIDQALVDRGVELFRQGGRDLVTNVFPRSFPRGQSVEVRSTASLRASLPRMTLPEDREHVTAALYRDPAGLAIENFDAGPDSVGPDGGAVRLVLDTPADAALIERVFAAMERPHWQYSWQQVLELAQAQTVVQ